MGSILRSGCRKKRNLQSVENRRRRVLSPVLSWGKVGILVRQHGDASRVRNLLSKFSGFLRGSRLTSSNQSPSLDCR